MLSFTFKINPFHISGVFSLFLKFYDKEISHKFLVHKINIVNKYEIYLKLIYQYPSLFILLFTNLVFFTVILSQNSIKKLYHLILNK